MTLPRPPRFVKACFCLELRTFGVILGWLGILASSGYLAILTYSIIVTVNFETQYEKVTNTDLGSSSQSPVADNSLSDLLTDDDNDLEYQLKITNRAFLFIVLMKTASLLVSLAASICLVIGSIKRKHTLLLPWLTMSAIGLIVTIFLTIPNQYSMLTSYTKSQVALIVLFQIIQVVLSSYLWMCIHSLYRQIKFEKAASMMMVVNTNPGVNYTVNDIIDEKPKKCDDSPPPYTTLA